MKKRILIAVASLVLAALILMLAPLGTPQLPLPTDPEGTTSPTVGTDPVVTDPTGPVEPTEPGAVRLYSCNETYLPIFRQMAAQYTSKTGVEVVILSPEEGDCQATLKRYMESEDPPTVFCLHDQKQLKSWRHTLLNLEDTTFAAALCSDDLGMWLDGKLLGIPLAVQGYGMLVNAEILATKGALSRNEITNFTAMATAVKILKDNSVTAFPIPNLTIRDAWYLLMAEDLDGVRAYVDLYMANCGKTGTPFEQFLQGKTAFCPGGSWEYDDLAAQSGNNFHVRNLDILPNFSAGAMQYICDSLWCVNASARQEDIQATMEFMTWMVTAGSDGSVPIDVLEVLTPFADSAFYGNWLENKLRGYMRTEPSVLQFDGGEMGTDPMLMALLAYMEKRTDENWQQVVLAVQTVRAQYGYTNE